MEEGIFPGMRCIGESEEMEEERRLCYVAMTRAKERLIMTNARQRMLFGRTTSNKASRFLEEVPGENSIWQGKPEPRIREEHTGFEGEEHTAVRIAASAYRRRPRPAPDRGYSSHTAGGSATADLLQLSQGDMVTHRTFGKGMVLSVRKMGNDALVEVAFDQVGTKKLMLRSAGVHMSKL